MIDYSKQLVEEITEEDKKTNATYRMGIRKGKEEGSITRELAHEAAMAAAHAAARVQQFQSSTIGSEVAQAYLQAYEAVEGWAKQTLDTDADNTGYFGAKPKKQLQVFLRPGEAVILNNRCTGKKTRVRLSENGLAYVWDAGDTGGRIKEDEL